MENSNAIVDKVPSGLLINHFLLLFFKYMKEMNDTYSSSASEDGHIMINTDFLHYNNIINNPYEDNIIINNYYDGDDIYNPDIDFTADQIGDLMGSMRPMDGG